MGDFGDLLYDNSLQMTLAKPAFDSTFKPEDVRQMRTLLDDPSVSNENKQNMLYALSDMKALSPDEVVKYSKQVGADGLDVLKGGRDPMQNLVHAKVSLATGAEQQRQGQAKQQLDGSQKRLDEGNFNNSDEIIDQADVGLRIFDEFYPRYTKAGGQSTQGASADVGGVGLDPNSLRAATAELRGIDFTAFKTDADALTQAGKTVSDSSQHLGQAWGGNMTDWKGSAATAAKESKSKLDAGAQALSSALNSAPGTITQGAATIEKQVTDFAENCLKQWGDGKMAQLTPPDVDNLLQSKEQLPGMISQLQQKIQELNNRSLWDKISGAVLGFFIGGPVGAIAGVVGISFADKITGDNIQEETQKYQQALADTQTKLQQFVSDYSTRAHSVQQQVDNAKQGVQQSYDAMLQGLGKGLEQDPFAQVAEPNNQGGDGPGGGGGGGGPSGGGGAGSTDGGGATPAPTTPSDPAAIADAAKKEAEQGVNPITGQPLEIDPSTGQPYPVDPKTGEAIKNSGDTMTVQQGDNKIEMSEPGKDGKMDIKIDDGHGDAKDFKLDWGDGKDAASAAGQTGGEAAVQAGGETGDKAYTPGADGKIHIQNGNLEITAERPQGADGPTVVTVDDGTGKPTTYTLGGDDAAQPGADAVHAGATPGTDAVQGAVQADAASGAEQAAGTSAAQQSSGFTAPGGIEVDHGSSTGAEAAAGAENMGSAGAAGSADTAAGVDSAAGADGSGTASAGAETAATDVTQHTTPAGLMSDVSPFDSGAVSGTLGDPGALDAGSMTGVTLDTGQAVLGQAPVSDPAGQHAAVGVDGFAGQTASSGSSGMSMMGMGGMSGGGGGGGEDTERSSRAYRVDGGIFNTSGAGGRISGSLDDDS